VTRPEADDVALKLLHTADWHLGRRFPSFDEGDQLRLMRARVEVLDRIFALADQHGVHAVLCAGDLFDEPSPDREWWEPVAQRLRATSPGRPVFLLPGNHDPLQPGSLYEANHAFRRALPSWVHVVDSDDFSFVLNDVAILHARPCRSRAGQDDNALALPARAPGDERIRIGLVHGSTFDMADCQTNFPIAKEAAALRGFDYLAIGDTHSFRNVPDKDTRPPVVYPGAPEATSFDEPGAGNAVVVLVSRSRRVRFEAERVGNWRWMERTVRSLAELRDLGADPHLKQAVVRLVVDMRLSAPDLAEAERLLEQLKGSNARHGRIGILQTERRRLELDSRGIEAELTSLPDVLRATVARLKDLESGEQPEVARAALYHLYRLVREAGTR
jgi:DNA repair exonuclease SbcCD nuclease subunit